MNIIGIVFIALSIGTFATLKDLYKYFNENFIHDNKYKITIVLGIVAFLLFIAGIHLITLEV